MSGYAVGAGRQRVPAALWVALLGGPSTSPLDATMDKPSRILTIFGFFLIGGCTGGYPDLDAATHTEEATVGKLVHREDSFESINKTLTARDYLCSDQETLDGGRVLTCDKDIGWKHFCKWSVLVTRVQTRELDNFNIAPLYNACH